ncbi:hypothetical protein [Almyronema epifaneia]|uniref:Uncharacterized protein n=1 Tax=Almyronema epifaneia S1 TaxID=2991925 RepID=A0ABW6IFG1_9CYAN
MGTLRVASRRGYTNFNVMKSGIYAVANIGALRLYLGETHQLKARWQPVLTQLSQGQYADTALQAEWIKQRGDRHFTFHTATDLVAATDLLGREQLLNDLAQDTNSFSTIESKTQ